MCGPKNTQKILKTLSFRVDFDRDFCHFGDGLFTFGNPISIILLMDFTLGGWLEGLVDDLKGWWMA